MGLCSDFFFKQLVYGKNNSKMILLRLSWEGLPNGFCVSDHVFVSICACQQLLGKLSLNIPSGEGQVEGAAE